MTTEVLDPRPPAANDSFAPAMRIRDLSRAQVLLFDNGKLGAGYEPRGAIFDVVRETLQRKADTVRVSVRSHDLLVPDLAEISNLMGATGPTNMTGSVPGSRRWMSTLSAPR